MQRGAAARGASGMHVFYPEPAVGGVPAQLYASVAGLRHQDGVGQRTAVYGGGQLLRCGTGDEIAVTEGVEVIAAVVGKGHRGRRSDHGACAFHKADGAVFHDSRATYLGTVVGCQGHRGQLAWRHHQAVDDGIGAADSAQRYEASVAAVALHAYVHVAPAAGRSLDGLYGHEALPHAALAQHANSQRRAAAQAEIEVQVAHTVYGYLGQHQAAHGVALAAVGEALFAGHGDHYGFLAVGRAVMTAVEAVALLGHQPADDMLRRGDVQQGAVPRGTVHRGVVYVVVAVAVAEEHTAGRHYGYRGRETPRDGYVVNPDVDVLRGGLGAEGYVVGAVEARQRQVQRLPHSCGVEGQGVSWREGVGVGGHRHLAHHEAGSVVVAGAQPQGELVRSDVGHRQLRQRRYRGVAGGGVEVQRLVAVEGGHARSGVVGAPHGPPEGDAGRQRLFHVLTVGRGGRWRHGGHKALARGGSTADGRQVYVVAVAFREPGKAVHMQTVAAVGMGGVAHSRTVAGGEARRTVFYQYIVDSVPRAPRHSARRRRRHFAYGTARHRQLVEVHGAAARGGAQGYVVTVAAVVRQVGDKVLPASQCGKSQCVDTREGVDGVGVTHHTYHYGAVAQQALTHAVEVEAHHGPAYAVDGWQAHGDATAELQAVAAAVVVAVGDAAGAPHAPRGGQTAGLVAIEIYAIGDAPHRRPCVDTEAYGSVVGGGAGGTATVVIGCTDAAAAAQGLYVEGVDVVHVEPPDGGWRGAQGVLACLPAAGVAAQQRHTVGAFPVYLGRRAVEVANPYVVGYAGLHT